MSPRILFIALGYGGLAGVISAFTLLLMMGLQHSIWALGDSWLFTFTAVTVGGVLLAALQRKDGVDGLNEAIAQAANPALLRARKVAVLALSAIIAVAFGASIGPEAGLVAVVAELSILVGGKIAQTEQELKAVGASGNAAALAGVYGSPPAAASFEDDTLSPAKLPSVIAAISGLILFMVTLHLMGAERHLLKLPSAPRGDVASWWQAIPAALLGAVAAFFFIFLHRRGGAVMEKIGKPWLRTLAGSLLLAILLATFPLLRFSGHSQLPEIVGFAEGSAWWLLLGLALMKGLVTALSLVAGWPGGEFFPLAFAGAAAGSLTLALFPGADTGTVLTAGMVAATTVALHKPMAVILIMVFMLPGTALGPLLVSALIAMLGIRAQQRFQR